MGALGLLSFLEVLLAVIPVFCFAPFLCSQIRGGNKGDLVERVLLCMEYGCMPRCQECGGGRLKPNGSQFKCPVINSISAGRLKKLNF